MKKVIYILFVTLFTLLMVSITKAAQPRVAFDLNNIDQTEQFDYSKKIVAECDNDDNLNISATDEDKLDLDEFIFEADFIKEFLLRFFDRNRTNNSLQINYTTTGRSLPKYILFHSLQIDYI